MEKAVSWALIMLIVGMFASVIYRFDVNIPSYDDYAATLIFLKNYYYNNPDVPGKIRALFIPHNEHCIFLSRVSAVLSYVVSGKINFRGLVWYQNVYLFGVFLLIAGIIRQQRLPFYPSLLVVSFFLFNLAFWQVTLYYWGGISGEPCGRLLLSAGYRSCRAGHAVFWQRNPGIAFGILPAGCSVQNPTPTGMDGFCRGGHGVLF